MRFAHKRRAVLAMLGLVFVWPGVQFGLVHYTESNPWHMFGLAMYTVPYRVVGVGVARIYDGEPRAFDDGQLTPELEARIQQFAHLFDGGGRWAPTAPLLAALRQADPNADSFLVVPRVLRMNGATGMLEERKVRLPLGAEGR